MTRKDKKAVLAFIEKVPFCTPALKKSARRLLKLKNKNDPVNHPAHYTSHPSGVECITITEHHDFCIGNAIKYLWRQGLKDGASNVEDLEKAIWYIKREIAKIKAATK